MLTPQRHNATKEEGKEQGTVEPHRVQYQAEVPAAC